MQPPRNVVSTVAWRITHVGSVPSVCLRRLFVQERNKVYGAGYTGVVKCGKLYSNLYAGGPGVWARAFKGQGLCEYHRAVLRPHSEFKWRQRQFGHKGSTIELHKCHVRNITNYGWWVELEIHP
jgi:hypothetical protein